MAEKSVRIGGFEVLEKIGQGGMGVVYKARQISLDRIVALKILPPRLAKDESFVKRFRREALSAARLNHPNVVQVIDVGEDKGYHYLAMEYVEGRSLKQILKERGRLPEKEALLIVRQVAEALSYARKEGIVHRDIKPDNILVSSRGVAKLADLGLAKRPAEDADLTLSGSVVGTPYYIAPEQAEGREDIDIRADLYSLGATLYHMVVGEVPFSGPTPAAVMLKHLKDPPPDPRKKVPHLSAACAALILRLMEKDRHKRIQSPDRLMKEIDAILRGERAVGPVGAGRGLPAWVYPAAGVALIAVVSAVVLIARGGGSRSKPVAVTTPRVRPQPKQQVVDKPPASTAVRQADDRTAAVRKMFEYVVQWEKEHPDEYAELLRRYSKIRQLARGTPVEFEINDKVRERVAAVKERARKAVEQSWKEIKGKVDELVAVGDYDGAVALLERKPPKFAVFLRPRMDAEARRLRSEAEKKILDAIARAEKAAREGDPGKGLRILDGIKGIRYVPAAGKVSAAVARLKQAVLEKKKEEEERRALAARKALETLWGKFDHLVLEEGDVEAAVRLVKGVGREEREAMGEGYRRLLGLADAIETLRQKERRLWERLKGREVEIVLENGRQLKGTVKEVSEDGLCMEVAFAGGSAVVDVKKEDIPPAQRKVLVGEVVPSDAVERVASAVLAMAANDIAHAEELLGGAGDTPLAGHYATVLKVKKLGAREVRAEEAWKKIEEAAAGKLDKASGEALKKAIETIRKEFADTKVYARNREKLAAYLQAAEDAMVGFSLRKVFKGKVESFDPTTRRIVLVYDFSDEAQLADWEGGIYQYAGFETRGTGGKPVPSSVHVKGGRLFFGVPKSGEGIIHKAVFEGDIAIDVRMGAASVQVGVLYGTSPDDGWEKKYVAATTSYGGGGLTGMVACGITYSVVHRKKEAVFPSPMQMKRRGRMRLVPCRLEVKGDIVTCRIGREVVAEGWKPQHVKWTFPAERPYERVYILPLSWQRYRMVRNVRIEGTLNAQWLKGEVQGKNNTSGKE